MKFRRTPLVLALMLVFQSYCVRADDVVNTQLLKATGAKVAIETADYAINQIQNNNNQMITSKLIRKYPPKNLQAA